MSSVSTRPTQNVDAIDTQIVSTVAILRGENLEATKDGRARGTNQARYSPFINLLFHRHLAVNLMSLNPSIMFPRNLMIGNL